MNGSSSSFTARFKISKLKDRHWTDIPTGVMQVKGAKHCATAHLSVHSYTQEGGLVFIKATLFVPDPRSYAIKQNVALNELKLVSSLLQYSVVPVRVLVKIGTFMNQIASLLTWLFSKGNQC